MYRTPYLQISIADSIRQISQQFFQLKMRLAITLATATLILSGCVESDKPLLTDSKPLLGQGFVVHLYENFVDKKAEAFHSAAYHWKDGEYLREGGSARDVKRFVAQSISPTDFLIQGTGDNEKRKAVGSENVFDYWIGRRLVDGVYLIFAVNESDVDDTTRSAMCEKEKLPAICLVKSYDQLVMFARATAAKPVRESALGVILAK